MVTKRTVNLKLVEPPPEPLPGPITFDLPANQAAPGSSVTDGVMTTENPDGSATIDFNPDLSSPEATGKPGREDFYSNLALKMDDGKLSEIGSMLLDGIDRDDQSRREWLDTRARGITLLGLKLEDPKSDVTAGAPLEGMSTVRHPLLLESTVTFQATTGGELLPAAGPVKIRNDSTNPPKVKKPPTPPMPAPPASPAGGPPTFPPPMPPLSAGMGAMAPMGAGAAPPPPMPMPGMMPLPGMGHNGGPPLEEFPDAGFSKEELAAALEKDMNHYLTAIATEYYPDTDRMLFYVGFGGDGFKKVYNCPLRRRPVSESVDAENLIVSNATTDLQNCGRVTHKITMRKSIVKRMQILKEYRDVTLAPPTQSQTNAVEKEKERIQGQNPNVQQPQDKDYTIYETYCELELDEFAPRKFKGKGLPLPYCVTIEKDSRQVLSLKRNWREDDEECLPRQHFVQFPFIRGLGFYGLGFIHLVGNTTNALTAAWREMLDAGMFANFPGFLFNKGLGRQLTNQIRVPPGGGFGLELGAQGDIRASIMALPYKEPGPAFTAFVKEVGDEGKRLASTSQIGVGEGKQDAPVGTTLALIEQATKITTSVHKRLWAAQAEEFKLLKERFREDPEAFWRHNKKPTVAWKQEQFVAALDDNDLVPVADPNNPTSLHRIAKAVVTKELQKASPLLYDAKAVDERIFRVVGIDPEGLFLDQPLPPPPDPRLEAVKEKARSAQQAIMQQAADAKLKFQVQLAQLQDKALDRASDERIENIKLNIEKLRLIDAQIIHAKNFEAEQQARMYEMLSDQIQRIADLRMSEHEQAQDQRRQQQQHEFDMAKADDDQRRQAQRDEREHQQRLEHLDREHQAKVEQTRLMGEAKAEAARKVAAAKPKPAKGSKK